MKIYSVNYYHKVDAFMEKYTDESNRLFVTKEKASKEFARMKASVIESANDIHEDDPDELTISCDEENAFAIEDGFNDWGVSITEVEVEE